MDLGSLAKNINIPIISALLLGLMATIGPCTMATNIAALAYISRKVTDRKYAVITGSLYTLGRMFTYSVLGILIIVIGLKTPIISAFLQSITGPVMGPFLIVIGILMLIIDRIPFLNRSGAGLSAMGGKVADWGMIGGFPLGALFALAFCPYSAVLFFAVLMPLALKTADGITLPAFFAIGTGVPVLIFGTLLSLGVSSIYALLNRITSAERIIRIIVSLIFIGLGIYYIVQWIIAINNT